MKVVALVAALAVIAFVLQGRWLRERKAVSGMPAVSRLVGALFQGEESFLACPVCQGTGLPSAPGTETEDVCPVCFGVGGHYFRRLMPEEYLCPHCLGMGRRLVASGRACECEACGGRGLLRGQTARGTEGRPVRILKIECDLCGGHGLVRDPDTGRSRSCPVCFGLGYHWVRKTALHPYICPACGGMGRLPDPETGGSRPCARCGGRGLVQALSSEAPQAAPAQDPGSDSTSPGGR